MRFLIRTISLILFSGSFFSYSQSPDYTPLKCKGPIPVDFLELSSSKVKRDQEIINAGKLSKKEKESRSEFAVNTNYAVDQILLSGQVLYGDPLTEYLNRLADIILKDDAELRQKLRFYTLKSSVPNAFTTSQGIIFVTVGLMAQVENEAQLAFILCHEIIHFKEKHNYRSFKKAKEARSGAGQYKRMELEEKLKKLYSYTKEHEIEADKKGFELFQKTQYNSGQAIASFDMLLFSYLPFDEIEWSPSYFEDSFYYLPGSLKLETVKEISADEGEDDKEQTHPNIGRRKDALLNIADTTDLKTALFLTKPGDFENFQHSARIEIAFIYLIHADYERAFYHAYLLEKKYSDQKFANRIKAMALYGTYKHKLAEDNFEFADNKEVEGESQRVYYLFNKMKAKDMTILASREIWKYYLENTNDRFLETLAYESLSDVFKKANFSRTYFQKDPERKISETKEVADSNQKETKIEKLKKKKKKSSSDTSSYSSDYLAMAYIDLFKNPTFDKAVKDLSIIKKEEVSEKPKKNKGKHSFYKDSDGVAMGIDTIIMINPSYTFTGGISGKRNLLKEEGKEIYISTVFKSMAKKNGVHMTMLNTLDKENLNTETWNNYMFINQWLTERLNNDTLAMNLYYKQYVADLAKDYNTGYLGISGFKYYGAMGYEGFSTTNLTYFMVVFNINSSRLSFIEYEEFISKMKPQFIKGIVYSTFFQLKAKPKK